MNKLITPVTNQDSDANKYFVKDSELFAISHESHLSIGNKGRDAMEKLVKQRYVNISQSDIMLYLKFCRDCSDKKKHKRKELVFKPILHEELNSRRQVDLMGYQSFPSYDYKWVKVYQDHLTKYYYY